MASYKFVSEPDGDLVCLICLEVAEEPWQHGKCGRLFCKKCLDANGRHRPCPNCREIQPQYFEDNRSKCNIGLHYKQLEGPLEIPQLILILVFISTTNWDWSVTHQLVVMWYKGVSPP